MFKFGVGQKIGSNFNFSATEFITCDLHNHENKTNPIGIASILN